jgi:hypothetical protein
MKKVGTFDIAEDAGCGYATPGALTETALARKFNHPLSLKRHHTFGT